LPAFGARCNEGPNELRTFRPPFRDPCADAQPEMLGVTLGTLGKHGKHDEHM